MHSLEQAAWDIGLRTNANKTEYMYFKREWVISNLNSGPLKLVDKFTYLDSSVSSTVDMHLMKAWTGIDRLSITSIR